MEFAPRLSNQITVINLAKNLYDKFSIKKIRLNKKTIL